MPDRQGYHPRVVGADGVTRATADAMIDRARATQAKVARGALDGRAPSVQAECREVLATIDFYLAELDAGARATVSRELVARLEAPAARYTPTVVPRRRVVVAGKV